jgi:hypothetical protein
MSIEDMQTYLVKAETERMSYKDLQRLDLAEPESTAFEKQQKSLDSEFRTSDINDNFFTNYLRTIPASTISRRSSWWRMQVTDGVEMNIREDVYRRREKKINKLIEQMKNELGEEER